MDESTQELPRVLAVIVTHNGALWLEECLAAVAGQDYPSLDVVVIDNASEPPAGKVVARALPSPEFIRVERNAGFGAAANLALESSARAPVADFYLFLHDDVVLHPGCVSRLVAAALETNAGVVGGKGVSWEHPDVLLEVGMTADQFAYPFSGLEEGEIDQGQHDLRREVLFVTSACCLLSRALVERCGSWDVGCFMFGEDLDLCIRGRLAGFRVVCDPSARFRHAVATVSGERVLPEGRSIRFYTRRNRLRTIAKTAAAYRMWAIMLAFLAINAGEMVALAALRRFAELPDYPRAFFSFVGTLPDVVRRRRAVQKRRSVPDRRVRRFMVRDIHRIRIFAERQLRQFEVGTLRLGSEALARISPQRLKATFGVWVRRPESLVLLVLVGAILFALRGVLLGEPLAAGGVWPYPRPTRGLIADYLAGWRNVGLGSAAPAPAALVIAWAAAAAAFGDPRLAQALLVGGLIALGLIGIGLLVGRRTNNPWARLAAVAAYGLGPVIRSAAGGGDLGALALFAGAPYLLEVGLRMLGPTPGDEGDRPAVPLATDPMTQNAVRLGLITAFTVALAPSALVAVVFLWIVTGAFSYAGAWDRRELLRRLGWVGAGVATALIVLFPWSIEVIRPRGALLGPISSGRGPAGTFGPLWADSNFTSMLLLDPRGAIPSGLVAPAIALGTLILASATRRRGARLMVAIWLAFAMVGGLVAKGLAPAPVASPSMWMMLPMAAVAALAGHLVAGLREELPRHVLGWRHALTGLVVATIVAGVGGSWIPELARWGRPDSTLAASTERDGRAISSFFVSNAQQVGEFRILWLGSKWVDPVRAGSRRMDGTPYIVTGPGGLTFLDLYDPSPKKGERRLDEVVEALVGRRLHHAGHLLTPAGIRYVAIDVDDEPLISAMHRQGDFVLEPQQRGLAIFRNLNWVPRASFAPLGLAEAAVAGLDDRALMLSGWIGGRRIPPRAQSSFESSVPRTRHPLILLGDNFDRGWRARVEGARLEHGEAFGWSNRFEVPPEAEGRVVIEYSRRWIRRALVLFQAAAVALAVAMARLRGGTIPGMLR